MTIVRARSRDAQEADALLLAARHYLAEQGIDQWQTFPPTPQETRLHLERGELYLVREGEAAAGTFVLVDGEPCYDVIDGSWLHGGRYVALHRVAVSPLFRRRGVASHIFAFAREQARARGARSVRIDTHFGNLPMRAALEKCGFVLCGTIRLATGECRAAYEMSAENKMKVVAATGNAHKLREFREIFPDWDIVSEREAGFCGEVEETGHTFLENALLKARAVCAGTGLPALADDSGIAVEALGGAPGVYSARYSGGDDRENRLLLLKNMQNVADRRAHFACAVALVFPDGREVCAEGRTEGEILRAECGRGGFGYDCIFFSSDLSMSFGEATQQQKNSVSHRARALAALASKL